MSRATVDQKILGLTVRAITFCVWTLLLQLIEFGFSGDNSNTCKQLLLTMGSVGKFVKPVSRILSLQRMRPFSTSELLNTTETLLRHSQLTETQGQRTIASFLSWHAQQQSDDSSALPLLKRISPREFCTRYASVIPARVNFDAQHWKSERANLCVDVRNPKAFDHGHIPGSLNIPLLTDEEHARVGTVYNTEGSMMAIQLGSEYIAPKLSKIVEQVADHWWQRERLNHSQHAISTGVYCARGGMRSTSVGWLLQREIGNQTSVDVLATGYKGFREFAVDTVYDRRPGQLVVIGGHTGSSKTRIVRELDAYNGNNFAAIDLEAEARHAGSAFGGIGYCDAQPTTAQYQNQLAVLWNKLCDSGTKVTFLEDEGPHIGQVQLPNRLYQLIRTAKWIVRLHVRHETRVKELVEDYSGQRAKAACDANGLSLDAELSSSLKRIRKRLGGQRLNECLGYLDEKDYVQIATILTTYYDGLYERHVKNHTGCGSGTGERQGKILELDLNAPRFRTNAGLVDAEQAADAVLQVLNEHLL